MIVFDASTIVSAALKANSVPERALLKANEIDNFALSIDVMAEIAEVLGRPKFSDLLSPLRRDKILRVLEDAGVWFRPEISVADCRDQKDNKYLELALAANAQILVSSDDDLLALNPWRSVRILRPREYLDF